MLHSIRRKVLLVTISITLITAFVITAVFYQESSARVEENYGENMYARVRQIGDAFDADFKEIYYLNTQMSCDSELLSLSRKYRKSGDEGLLEDIAGLLREYSRRMGDVHSVYFVIPEEKVVVTSLENPVYRKNLGGETVRTIEDLTTHAATPATIKDPLHPSSFLMAIASTVKDEEGKPEAYVMSSMDERRLYYKYLDGLEDKAASFAVILNQENEVASAREQSRLGAVFQNTGYQERSGDGVLNRRDSGRLSVTYQVPFTGFHFYMEVEKDVILGDLNDIRYFLVFILLLCCGIAAVLAYFITGAMYRPMKKLTKTMEQIGGGDLEQRVEITTKDEIGALSREFNNMLDHIQELIGQLLREEMLKRDAELEALQYQITPHFMYNTLNSIKYAALLKGEKEIGGLVEDFIELLQASINKKGNFVTVAEEVNFLKHYINLQRMRYEDRIKVDYEVLPEAEGFSLPRLLLQPLVENAILHGLDMKDDNSRITIRAEVEAGRLHLTVADNGRGMSKEQIRELLTGRAKKTSGLSGIGVANVRERLELYYGGEGKLCYESSGEGTLAHIFLPAYKEQNQYSL